VDLCGVCQLRKDRLEAELSAVRHIAAKLPDGSAGQAAHPPAERETGDPTLPEEGSDQSSDFSEVEDLPAPDEDHARPDSIGRYRIVGELDPGGQALVYRAIHPTLPLDLAIKIARNSSPIDRSLLKQDAGLLSMLEHPNLVRVYDLDTHEGRPFVVMEYVRGRNLQQVAEEALPSPRQAAAWVAAIARALEYVHGREVVHQDIKPENVMVDESGRPRLIDFGVARWRHAWSGRRAGPFGGTLAYMAPEQARGETQRIGPSSDIFALGGVLYFQLTGKSPFGGGTGSEQWRRARECDFDRSALRAKQIPRALERIVLKAMAADPVDRFASADALRNAVERYLSRGARRAAVSVLAGIGLLGLFFYAVLPRGTPGNIATPVPIPSPIPIVAEPMKGRIDLLVVASKDGTRRRLRLNDPGAVPLRAGDEVRIEAGLDRPAYLYLFWLGSEGKLAPLYPWKDHDWSTRPAEEKKVTTVEVPEVADDVLTMPRSPSGMETLVLLAREDSPLPPEHEAMLAEGLAGSPVLMPPGMRAAIWLEDGQEVVFGPTHGPRGGERGEEPLTRGIPSPQTRKSDDPVLRIRAIVENKLQPLGSYSQAVLFPNEGR
jgi:predicted Ser/Thr protein kinase